MEVPRLAFHYNLKVSKILVGFIGREFVSESLYGQSKILGLDRQRAQPLDGISALGDRLSGLIDSAVKSFFGFFRTRR